jgi:glycerophosphoryl diester phosphodiesterase
VDRVETDVYITRDGVPVCIHDPTVERTTDGSGRVQDLSLEELRRLDAGMGERIPTLLEALHTVRDRAVMVIELKGVGTPEPTLAAIEAAGLGPEDVLVISFDIGLLAQTKQRRSDIPLGLLYSSPPPNAIAQARELGGRGIHVYFGSVTAQLVQNAHAAGLEVGAWTTNTRDEIQQAIDLGMDVITSDRPDILIHLLQEIEGTHESSSL